jgi:predicted RNase H-like HicB family nuclease
MQNQFTAAFYREGDSWVGSVEEFPGTTTRTATLEEAKQNLKQQVKDILAANRGRAAEQLAGRSVMKEPLIMIS